MDNENKALDEKEVKEPEVNKKADKPAKEKKEKKKGSGGKVSLIIGIVLCVILVPILIANSVLIVKGIGDDSKPPSIFGYVPLTVLTESMEPLFDAGDMIFIEEVDVETIKVGDVICFKDPQSKSGKLVTHRVVFIERERNADGKQIAWTAGDFNVNNDYNDSKNAEYKAKFEYVSDPNEEGYKYWCYQNTEPDKKDEEAPYDTKTIVLDENTVVGVYAYSGVPFVGYVSDFMAQPYGWIICIGVPLVAFVLYEVLSRRKNDKEKKQDMDALLAELEALKAAKASSEASVADEPAAKNDTEVAEATETDDPPSQE